MKRMIRLLAIASLIAFSGFAIAGDWPHLRGPNLDGGSGAGEILDSEHLALKLAWTVPLGPGYSGIAVADGRAVTMFSDGEADHVIAVEIETGEPVWRHRIGDTYKGHDGSRDGPLSTPLIDEGVVYALGPRGQLFALKLSDGKKIWAKTMEDDFGSKAPHFGFGTTPLVEGNVLVVQAGGSDGRAICGIDKKTGKRLWSLGDGAVEYQSPSAMELVGRRQIVVVNGKRIQGLLPKTGDVLWEHTLGENDQAQSASASFVSDDRFLALISGDTVMFRATKTTKGYEVEELYRSKGLGSTYAVPVYHDGYLYGFRQQFLSCINAETGERVWRSRPPGGRGLILVDGHLVIYGAQGNVVIAEATPEGYAEKAKIQALEGSGYTWPSFADGKVFVRNLEKMASISVIGRAETAVERTVAAVAPLHEFGAFVSRVETSTGKQDLIDEFMAKHETFPIIEGEFVHFVYQGEVDDIAITGSMMDGSSAEPMDRIAGTDFFHKTYALESGGRWEYLFNVDFDKRVADPLNPRSVPSRWRKESLSEVVLPGYEAPAHLAEPRNAERGTLEEFSFESEIAGKERKVTVYLPPGYGEGERSYPLLIVHNGPDWLEKGLMANSLDNLIGERVDPVIVAFLAPIPQWWLEAGGSGTDDYVRMLAEELVPRLEKNYRLIGKPDSRALMGTDYFGAAAAYGALKYPKVFGKAAIQSAALGLGARDALLDLVGDGGSTKVQFYLDWNRYESRAVDSGMDLREDSLALASALEESGRGFTGGEVLDSNGWGSWRARTDRILEAFFPADGHDR